MLPGAIYFKGIVGVNGLSCKVPVAKNMELQAHAG